MDPLFDFPTTDSLDTAVSMNCSGTLVARSATTRHDSVVDVHRVIDGTCLFSYTLSGYWVMSLCYIHRSGEDRLLVMEGSVYLGRGIGCRCTELDRFLRVIRRKVFTTPRDSEPGLYDSEPGSHGKAIYSSATDEIIAIHSEHLLVYKYADFSLRKATKLPDFYPTALTLHPDEQSCMVFCPNIHKILVYCIRDLTLMTSLLIGSTLCFTSFTCFPSGCILGATVHGDAVLLDERQNVVQSWNNVRASTFFKSSSVAVCASSDKVSLFIPFENTSRFAWLVALIL